MRRNLSILFIAFVCAAAVFAQAKQPKPKSQKEVDALMAVQNATDNDARIAAINNALEKFADTEFKPGLLMMAAALYQSKGDQDNMMIFAERALEADPASYQAMLMLGSGYATRTRENDLDKEDKLAKAESFSKKALDILKTAEKPRPDITDEQWTEARKQLVAQAHEVLGTSAMVRKKYDVAITEYKTAVEGDSKPDATTLVRLGSAYNQAGKPDEAQPILEKVMAMTDVNPQVKSVAQAERVRSIQLKSKSAAPAEKPATPPTAPAPVPVPVK